MNKTLKVAVLSLLLATTLGACSKVPVGNVGVKAYLLGGSKGVDSEELSPGRYWIGINEELFLFPTFTQTYTWTAAPDDRGPEDESITFQTREGLKVNADVGVTYAIEPSKATTLFQKYRKGINEITDLYLRNMVKDALTQIGSKLPIESVYGEGKSDLINEVQKMVASQVAPFGINIEKVYWVSELRLPETVVASIDAKIAATQKSQQRQNEVAQSRAEAQKKVEEAKGLAESITLTAKAQAEANIILSKSLTPELVNLKWIEKWDGSQPKVTGGGAGMLVSGDQFLKDAPKKVVDPE